MVGQFGPVIGIYKKIYLHLRALPSSPCVDHQRNHYYSKYVNFLFTNYSLDCSSAIFTYIFHAHMFTLRSIIIVVFIIWEHIVVPVCISRQWEKHFINWSLCHVNELEKLSFYFSHCAHFLKLWDPLKFGTFSRVVSKVCTHKLQTFINEGMSDEMLINWYSSWSKYSHDASIAESETHAKTSSLS